MHSEKDNLVTDIKQGKHKHFKGSEYEVIATAKHSGNMEKLVVLASLVRKTRYLGKTS